jgi:XisI protein
MDNHLKYQNAIVELLNEYQSYLSNATLQEKDDRFKVLTDEQHHHYQLLVSGWKADKYRFKVLFHLDIINNKVWLQQNDTEFFIADELMEKGVAREDIVLGFLPVRDRAYSGFAAA